MDFRENPVAVQGCYYYSFVHTTLVKVVCDSCQDVDLNCRGLQEALSITVVYIQCKTLCLNLLKHLHFQIMNYYNT